MNDKFLIVIMGPTSSGKSDLSIKISQKIPSEIISADSMQVYKGMDIGTAKATSEQQKQVRHHLIDILDINERLEVYSYTTLAQKAIKEIWSRGKTPMIVGGSGMYIKALLYGLDPLPSDIELRNKLYKKFDDDTDGLIEVLKSKDPKALELYETKPRKMIRALEVLELTGKSILDQNEKWDKNKLLYNVNAYKLTWNRKDLFDRIIVRTEEMLQHGWIEETERLIKKGLLNSPTAWQAIGYNIIAKYLSKEISYDEMKMRIISSTKKYVRRQDTWFKNQHPEAEDILLPEEYNDILKKFQF
ncbi:MAG: tRNA (adenosine(37)-N6)-dimethylallyltransferase MiaA [bacterium]|nr:tRNA (adenosine(37)-N6)-dimethylallyltransferase MiaA [bacterium]